MRSIKNCSSGNFRRAATKQVVAAFEAAKFVVAIGREADQSIEDHPHVVWRTRRRARVGLSGGQYAPRHRALSTRIFVAGKSRAGKIADAKSCGEKKVHHGGHREESASRGSQPEEPVV
jgi:hypothetical protein